MNWIVRALFTAAIYNLAFCRVNTSVNDQLYYGPILFSVSQSFQKACVHQYQHWPTQMEQGH